MPVFYAIIFMKPLISVIIPIYKVEKYLVRCLNSVLNQSYANLEVWLVDDGSPDMCPIICDEYAKKDKRVRVIHKKNGGQADARNIALDKMTGEYVVFVDSDDYIAKTHIEGLYKIIKKYNAQVAINSYCSFHENEIPKPHLKSDNEIVYSGLEAVQSLFYQQKFDTAPWAKMFHRSLFDDVRFPKGIVFEDLATVYKPLLKANKVVFNDKESYYYLLRSNSTEGSAFSSEKLDSSLKAIQLMDKDKEKLAPIMRSYNCRIVSFAFHLMLQMPKGYIHRNEFEDRIKSVRWQVLTDSKARKNTRIACLLSYVGGFDMVQRIFNRIKTR